MNKQKTTSELNWVVLKINVTMDLKITKKLKKKKKNVLGSNMEENVGMVLIVFLLEVSRACAVFEHTVKHCFRLSWLCWSMRVFGHAMATTQSSSQ